MGAFAGRHHLYQLATVLATALVLSAAGRELVQKGGDHGFATRVGLALQQKDYSKAISMLESYISSHPADLYSAYSFLGEIYEQVQMKNKALDTYERGPQDQSRRSHVETGS